MSHLQIAKAALAAGIRVEVEFTGGDRMHVACFGFSDMAAPAQEDLVSGQMIEGTLDQIVEDQATARPISAITAYRLVV